VGKAEAKRRIGRPRRRWKDNIKMDLTEIGLGDMGWNNLAQDRYRCYKILGNSSVAE
jgi:hypothetical protein